MSAAPSAAAGAPPAAKGKKKLLVIIVVAVVLLLVAAGGAVVLLKKKAHDSDAADEGAASSETAHADKKPDLKHPPTFLPLDPFVVNLADKESDRYAQIGITIEVADEHFAEQMKAFMPAIRNGILMILSRKTSKDLLDAEGKQQLASEILIDASRTMGIEVAEPDDQADKDDKDDSDSSDEDKPKAKSKKKKKKQQAAEPNPINHVHFSNFIVQ